MVRSTFVVLVGLASLGAVAPAESGTIAGAWERKLRFPVAAPTGESGPMPHLGFLSAYSQPAAGGERDSLSATPSLNLYSVSWAGQFNVVRSYELSRFDCALKGAGAATTLGWCLAALANTTDLWDERTSWYVGGACAAAGAILGGTLGADNAGWSVRTAWEPER